MCGKNNFECAEMEFVAGCNRFGLDNPCPIITRRLATYGNEENVEKIVERLAKQYNDAAIVDADKFGSVLPDKTMAKAGLEPSLMIMKQEKKNLRDMQETQVNKRTTKKVSGVHDIKMLDKSDNAKKFESPANVVLARGI